MKKKKHADWHEVRILYIFFFLKNEMNAFNRLFSILILMQINELDFILFFILLLKI